MQRTLIWDLPTRVFHWALAASFALAWLTAESDTRLPVHVFLGYLMLGLVGFRLLWGFAGSHFSRFANFWFGPRDAWVYLKQVATGRAQRHVGHNPTGSLAIYVMLGLVVAVALSGVLTLGAEEQQGLAAGWVNFAQAKLLKKTHEAAATLMLGMVMVHIAGVLVESLLHRENLARAMLNGVKLAEPGTPAARARPLVAGLMLLAMLGFGGWWFSYAIGKPLHNQAPQVKFVGSALPDNPQWRDECASCHAAFYPSLLPTRSWQQMMAEQDKHFGTDLGLAAPTTATVLKFLENNSADHHLTEAGLKIDQSLPKTATPERITDTPYWIKKHRDIAAADWANPLVKSKNNCAACHSDAEAGTYEDGAMQIPKVPLTASLGAPAAAGAASQP